MDKGGEREKKEREEEEGEERRERERFFMWDFCKYFKYVKKWILKKLVSKINNREIGVS